MAYLPLSTANLPDPVIDPATGSSPEDHFGILLWTGDGTSNQSVTGLNFQPDLVFSKGRNFATGGVMLDAVRGSDAALFTNVTNAETTTDTNWNTLTFQSGGFNTGSGIGFNNNTSTFVAWNWKANGSGTSIAAGSIDGTNPTITSTVSANTTSGFSIVSYTSPNTTNVESIGHGLTQAPDMVICKNRNNTYNWDIWHKDLTQGSGHGLMFNTNAQTAGRWPNSVVTDSLVYLAYNFEHYSTNDYIAYCFHSVEGFSKFGSYTGNGSTDGPFVYTGFRPAFVMIKGTNAVTSWYSYDSTRDTYNACDSYLSPDSSAAEGTATSLDFLSNGFKLKIAGSDINTNGNTHIFACFAENPFKYSNAR